MGQMMVMYCHPFRLDQAKIVAPNHRVISPTQLGCLEYAQSPTDMNFPLLLGSSLKFDFCLSEVTSITIPEIQIKIPIISIALRCPLQGIDADVLTARRGLMVMTTHSPWMSQAQKNLVFVFLISLNLVSSFALRIRRKRNDPNLPAQIITINPAMTCSKLSEGLVSKEMRVMERKVKLPVKSQYFSELLSSAGINATTCTRREYGTRIQGRGTPKNYLECLPSENAKKVERVSTTIGVITFFMMNNKWPEISQQKCKIQVSNHSVIWEVACNFLPLNYSVLSSISTGRNF